MRTIEQIKGRCVITEDDHWLWSGALHPDGRAHMRAPNYTNGGLLMPQTGPRAVWQIMHGKAVPAGMRVYHDLDKCEERTCCNPDHFVLMTRTQAGAKVRASGSRKGNTKMVLAARRIAASRSVLTDGVLAMIHNSVESNRKTARRLGISDSTVGKARRMEGPVAQRAAGMFSGLLR